MEENHEFTDIPTENPFRISPADKEILQGALIDLAAEFEENHGNFMQYTSPMASTVAGDFKILFVFLGPSADTINGRPDQGFWNPFKNSNGEWLHSITLCEEVLTTVNSFLQNRFSSVDSMDNVFLMDLFPFIKWDANTSHNITKEEKELAKMWFSSNIELIKPEVVVIFTAMANFRDDDKDLLGLQHEFDLSTCGESLHFQSCKKEDGDYSFKVCVVDHPGALFYVSNKDETDKIGDFIKAFVGMHSIVGNDHLNLENAIVDQTRKMVFDKRDPIVDYVRGVQNIEKENKVEHIRTLKAIHELIHAERDLTVSIATLRSYLDIPHWKVGKRGNAILYDLTVEETL
eukprot:gene15511-17375_t